MTTFHTDEPMSSYLTTIAIGDYRSEQQETASGVPITLWVPRDKPHAVAKVRFARQALEWCEDKLGPYPFSTAGILVTDSQSGMETQTMITLGDNDYVLSKAVLVHEFVHQWYGDQTSPTDWRDVWMNEGMTMYLQAVYTDETGGNSLEATMDDYAAADAFLREQSGPPGAYDPATFGEGNIYYLPALMWHTLREEIGDDAFWAMVRAWPSVHDNASATREQYVDWVEETTGVELSEFFSAWLDGTETPPREVPWAQHHRPRPGSRPREAPASQAPARLGVLVGLVRPGRHVGHLVGSARPPPRPVVLVPSASSPSSAAAALAARLAIRAPAPAPRRGRRSRPCPRAWPASAGR